MLTREQLQADLDAAKKREDILFQENERYRNTTQLLEGHVRQLTEERDDWRFAFRTICKVVGK